MLVGEAGSHTHVVCAPTAQFHRAGVAIARCSLTPPHLHRQTPPLRSLGPRRPRRPLFDGDTPLRLLEQVVAELGRPAGETLAALRAVSPDTARGPWTSCTLLAASLGSLGT